MFILKQVLSDTFRCLLYTQGFFLFNGIKCFLLKKSTKVSFAMGNHAGYKRDACDGFIEN